MREGEEDIGGKKKAGPKLTECQESHIFENVYIPPLSTDSP